MFGLNSAVFALLGVSVIVLGVRVWVVGAGVNFFIHWPSEIPAVLLWTVSLGCFKISWWFFRNRE
jgi:hypothetical protein